MQITDSTPTASVVIQGHTFNIAQPFAEGSVLNANEAAAMNQLLAENIRNNFAGKVKSAKVAVAGENASKEEIEAAEIGDTELDALQTELTNYVSSYEFGVRKTRSGGSGTSAFEKLVYRVAEEALRAKVKEAGKKVTDIADDVWEAAVDKLAASENIKAEAQRRMEAKKAAANDGDLADLGL